MANFDRITPIQIEKWTLQRISIPDSSLEEDYDGSTESDDMSISPDMSCRSSADADKNFDLDEDFRKKLTKYEEDIIEKIENLRLACNNEDTNEDNEDTNKNVDRTSCSENVDNIEYRDSCKPQTGSHTDNEDINNNENNVTVDDNESCLPLNICDDTRDKKRCHSSYNGNFPNNDSETEQAERQEHEDSDDSDLIQRGPIRPNFQSPRECPYYFVNWQSCVNDGADAAYYEKTAEEILKNKDYCEKLKPCLDKLSDSTQNQALIGIGLAMDPNWTGENNNDIYYSEDPKNNTTMSPTISVINDSEEKSLMIMLSRGSFQAATVLEDTGSHSIPSPSTKTWSDSPASSYNCVVSRSNSRASSRAQSPGSATNLESPQMHINIIGSPVDSLQVVPTYRTPQALSSSSSSNQSYGDVSSPLNYQTSLNYQTEKQIDESLRTWKGISDSSGTLVDSSDTITDFVQLFTDSKVLEKPQDALNAPFFSSAYNDVSVQTLGNDLNPASHKCAASDMQNEKLETCLGIPNTNSIQVGSVPSNLVSVYTSKGNTGGCTFVNSVMNGHSANMGPRYYESNIKNNQINVMSQPDALLEIGLTNETSAKMSKQNLRVSQDKYTMFHADNGQKIYTQSPSFVPNNYVPNDYQIPTMVSSFVPSHPKRNLNRTIAPWRTLKLPSVPASQRLKESLDSNDLIKAMSNLLKKPEEDLTAVDEDGDTELMCLVANPEELKKKIAYLVPLVERMGNVTGALSMMNIYNKDALYLAAMNCPNMPYVTGYLAAAMLQQKINISQTLYHGNTLIHSVAARGDSHEEILKELLALRTEGGKPVFDLSRCNNDGKTALHVAVESHNPERGVKSLFTSRLLLENGANINDKGYKCGDTALHMAVSLSCDPTLIEELLKNIRSLNDVNETNFMYNTPLHIAAAVSNTVSLEKQKKVCQLLIQAGSKINILNQQGEVPLALVSSERKEDIKRIFRGHHKKER